MGPVWALLLLFPIAQGAALTCDARQNNTQCYGALGGTLQIRLMDKGSTTYRCEWLKKLVRIFTWRNTTPNILNDNLKNRSEFNPSTGIFHLRNLSKDDTDSYSLLFLDKNGRPEKTLTQKLIIEAPVSSVQLDPKCLSKEEKLVTCTAEGGGSHEFSWTLDGQTLTDSQLLSKNDANNIITLKQNTKGLLRCSVRNNVSQVYEERNISTCGYTFINCTVNGTQISDWVFEANNTLCIEHSTTPAAPSTHVAAFWPNVARVLVIVLVTAVVLFFVLKNKCWDKRSLKTSQPEPGLELSVI